MTDLARIKGNVAKMAAQNAPEKDIDGYIASEGVTIDDVRNFKIAPPPTPAPALQPGPVMLHDKFRDVPQAPVEQPDVVNNPQASVLPGPLGQLHNTFTAATAGGLNSSLLNLGQEAYAGVMGVPKAIMDASQGKGFDYPRAVKDELALSEETEAQKRALNPQAYDTGKVIGSFGSMGKARAGAPAIAEIAAPVLTKAAVLKSAGAGALVGAANGIGEPGSITDRLKNAAAEGLIGAAVGAAGGKLANGATKEVVPTAADLKSGYKTAFKTAEDTGAVIGRKSVSQYAQDALELLKSEGAVTPSGKVAGFPKVAHAINMMDDFATGDMSIAQAQTLRKAVAGAAKSTDPEERFVGVEMLNHFDRFMENLKPGEFIAGDGRTAVSAWVKARQIYQISKKGDAVTGLISAAQRQAKKSAHVSGEQAIRNKFDTFVSKPKNLRGYSAEERAQLEKVGNGTTVGNAAKAVGKLAPTTLGGIGVKAGIPFAVGSAIGGPVVGGTVAGASMGLGVAGRIISKLSTAQQAEFARMMVMNGGKLPRTIPNQLSAPVKRALGNLIFLVGPGKNLEQLQSGAIATPVQ